jgi:protein-disulfide isomerase/uncharacterized membrane protein
MTRRTAYGLLGLSVIALAASSASAWVHYHILLDPSYASFCSINQTWNCESAYESRFGNFHGIPVALGGVIWAWGALLLSWAALRATGQAAASPPSRAAGKGASRQPAAPAIDRAGVIGAYLFAFAIVGLSFVLYFAYASFFVLKIACVLCLTTYVAVAGIFILSGTAGSDITMRSLPGRALRDLSRPVVLALALASLAGAATLVAWFPKAAPPASPGAPAPAPLAQSQQSEFEKWYTQQPRVPIPVADDGAKVVVIKFQDYMCPPCRQTYLEYKPVLAKWQAAHPGMVKFIERDYPLDPKCNEFTPGGQHLSSCEAAVAHRLADERGRGAEMEAWLYDNQAGITSQSVREAAQAVGHVPDFEARYARTVELVKGDIKLGQQLGVKSTPTFFVNGVRIPGLQAQFFDAAIAYELKQAGVLK